MLQDGGRRILAQALRIDPALKGKGVGRMFMQLCREFILGLNKEVGGGGGRRIRTHVDQFTVLSSPGYQNHH